MDGPDPRIAKLEASPGDILEVVRHNAKGRFEFGVREGARYVRAVQGHSRTDVEAESMLDRIPEETLPERVFHGTYWNLFESMRARGLLSQKTLSRSKGKGKDKKGKEARQHIHFVSEEDRDQPGVSGFSGRVADSQTVRQSGRVADSQTVRQSGRVADSQTVRPRSRQSDSQTVRQSDSQSLTV